MYAEHKSRKHEGGGVECRCPGSGVALQALTQRKVDLAFRVYQALLGGAAGGQEAQPMDTDTQVRGAGHGSG